MDRSRFLVACVFGLAAGAFVAFVAPGGDASWPISGARRLLSGVNPYAAPYPELTSDPAFLWLYYPLPAILLCVPVIWLPDRLAIGVLCGACVGVLAYGCAPQPRRFLVFASYPLWACLWYANPWSLLAAAAWLLPSLAPLALAKPNAALPVLLSRPSWRWLPVGASGVLLLASIPLGWLDHLGSHENGVAILTPLGSLAALCILRYRDPRARLVLFTACMPLRNVDPVALLLLAPTWASALLLVVVSWLAPVAWHAPELLVAAAAVLTTVAPQTRRRSSAPRMPTAPY